MRESEHEAELMAEQARNLADAMLNHVPPWAAALITTQAAGPAAEESAERLRHKALESTLPEVVRLLESDIDAQWSSPLDLLRSLIPVATGELRSLGVEPRQRDAQALQMQPEDVYGLTPATFSDVHPQLHEPGLAWGAAKAHVHLRRHGGTDVPNTPPVVVVFAPDLADRSRFDPFEVKHVRSAGKLNEFAAATEPDLVIVDIDRTSAPADFRIENAHVVGFGSHVDLERQEEALDAGFDAVLARSVFFKRLPELLAPVARRSKA